MVRAEPRRAGVAAGSANRQPVAPHPFALPIASLPEAQALSRRERGASPLAARVALDLVAVGVEGHDMAGVELDHALLSLFNGRVAVTGQVNSLLGADVAPIL